MTVAGRRVMRSAEGWIGGSGFLVSWAMRLATSAQAEGRDRPVRINIAAWEDQFCRSRAELGLRKPIAELAFGQVR